MFLPRPIQIPDDILPIDGAGSIVQESHIIAWPHDNKSLAGGTGKVLSWSANPFMYSNK